MARSGAAVLALDHVIKDTGDRGRYPIGAQHTLSGVDGGAYRLEVVVRFRKDHVGSSRLKVAKDRPGHVRPHTSTYDRIAVFVLDSTDPARTVAELVPPETPGTPKPDADVDPEVAEAASRHLEAVGKKLSVATVRTALKKRGATVSENLEWLFINDYVTRHDQGKGKPKLYAHKAPYRAEAEGE